MVRVGMSRSTAKRLSRRCRRASKGRVTRAAFSLGQELFVRRVVAVATSSQESLPHQPIMSGTQHPSGGHEHALAAQPAATPAPPSQAQAPAPVPLGHASSATEPPPPSGAQAPRRKPAKPKPPKKAKPPSSRRRRGGRR